MDGIDIIYLTGIKLVIHGQYRSPTFTLVRLIPTRQQKSRCMGFHLKTLHCPINEDLRGYVLSTKKTKLAGEFLKNIFRSNSGICPMPYNVNLAGQTKSEYICILVLIIKTTYTNSVSGMPTSGISLRPRKIDHASKVLIHGV